ncbi:hypothetical protein [Bacillus cabrialesii]|nr:hypothetical protein [Bacillus cabrialesii]MDU0155296.1 hypothetical protein [Bacillus cabrialesii]
MIGPEIVDAAAKPNEVLVDFRWGAAAIFDLYANIRPAKTLLSISGEG